MNSMNVPPEQELGELRADLLRWRPPQLGPSQGEEAFQQHKLLAAAVHRAAKLDERGSESETESWVRYIVEHFPKERNSEADARLLFADWRTSLLKNGTPGPKVPITHGQSHAHWGRDSEGRLCLNLEDVWNDYAASVESFVAQLHSSPRRKIVLDRWRKQRWTVEPFRAIDMIAGATVMDPPASTSVSSSRTRVTIDAPPGSWFPISSVYSVTANPPPEKKKKGLDEPSE
jgi:hypothetical protein